MVDSFTLKLNTGQFSVSENNRFDGRKRRQGKGYISELVYLEKYREDLKKCGVYCPVINLAKKITSQQEVYEGLEIQASAPKLIYETNLFDASPEDIDKICKKLVAILLEVGITTTELILRQQAVIRQVDFCKVVKLPDYLGKADEIIYKLSRFNYRPQSKFDHLHHRRDSEGSFMRFCNTTRHYTIYDKLGEILDEGYTKTEQKIMEGFKEGKIKRSALKFELSLHRKDSLEAVLRRRIENKKADFTLEDIMSVKLARAILLAAFDEVFNDTFLGLITLSEMEDSDLRAYLGSSGLSIKKQTFLYYWVRMATNSGVAGTWARVRHIYSGGSVDRARKEISLALAELGEIKGNTPNLIGFLRQELNKFEIIKPYPQDRACKPLLNDLQLQYRNTGL